MLRISFAILIVLFFSSCSKLARKGTIITENLKMNKNFKVSKDGSGVAHINYMDKRIFNSKEILISKIHTSFKNIDTEIYPSINKISLKYPLGSKFSIQNDSILINDETFHIVYEPIKLLDISSIEQRPSTTQNQIIFIRKNSNFLFSSIVLQNIDRENYPVPRLEKYFKIDDVQPGEYRLLVDVKNQNNVTEFIEISDNKDYEIILP